MGAERWRLRSLRRRAVAVRRGPDGLFAADTDVRARIKVKLFGRFTLLTIDTRVLADTSDRDRTRSARRSEVPPPSHRLDDATRARQVLERTEAGQAADRPADRGETG